MQTHGRESINLWFVSIRVMCQIYRLLYSIRLFTSGVRNVQRASTCGTLWRMSVILYMCLSCLSTPLRSDLQVKKPTRWPPNSRVAHLSTIRLYSSRSISVLRTQMYVFIKEEYYVIFFLILCGHDEWGTGLQSGCFVRFESLRKVTAALGLNIFRKTYTVIMRLKTEHMALQIRRSE